MKRYLWSSLLLLYAAGAVAQDADSSNVFKAHIDVLAIGTANGQVPFWMRSNQFGSIPEYGVSGSLIAAVSRDYRNEEGKPRLLDWGAGFEGRLNIGRRTSFRPIEAYIKARFSIFQMKAGRSKDDIGIADPDLSSGNFSISGNALGIPKVELSIPDYWSLPFTKEILSVKGNLAYGAFGRIVTNTDLSLQREVQAYYHQKSFYMRIGKPQWKVKLSGGINHQVMWGEERKIYGDYYGLGSFSTLWYVTTGKAYGNDSIPRSKVGNHIGSIDQAITLEFRPATITFYHQFFYEVGGLYHLNNLKDGLWGVRITNKHREVDKKLSWDSALLELMLTKSQGGEPDAKITPSGDEDYYNNYLYPNGWTYQEENLGNNFLTNKKYQRKTLPAHAPEYFGNNRILLIHIAAAIQYDSWKITGKLSYSRNYGTYATSPIGNTTGTQRTVYDPPYFYRVDQCSGYLEASRPLKKGYSIGLVLAADYGDLLYNSLGGMIRLSKKW